MIGRSDGSGKGLLFAALMGKLGLLAGRLRHPFLEGDTVAVLRPGETLTEMADSHQAR